MHDAAEQQRRPAAAIHCLVQLLLRPGTHQPSLLRSVRRNLNNVRTTTTRSGLRSARPSLLNPVNTSNDAGNEKCHRLAK